MKKSLFVSSVLKKQGESTSTNINVGLYYSRSEALGEGIILADKKCPPVGGWVIVSCDCAEIGTDVIEATYAELHPK